MRSEIRELAQKLGIQEPQLKRLEMRYRRKHGEQAEKRLLAWLQKIEREMRDEVRLPARQNGLLHPPQYVSHAAGALRLEPESVPTDYQNELSESARAVFEVMKGEEKAVREARSRAERLRQAELELRRSGKSADHYVKAIEDAVRAMKQEAKAA